MACGAAEMFHQAAEICTGDARRKGNVIHLEGEDDLLVSGDVHGHRRNLTKIIQAADLANHPRRRLVLQEIIHGPPDARSGQDRTVDMLLRAVRLQVQHPQQVLFVLANHDLAQVTGNEIAKQGRGACKAFTEGVQYAFGDEADEVSQALNAFLLAQPLAVRSAGGVHVSHSLPAPDRMELGGVEILDRPYQPDDLRRGGPVYEWTWGRNQTPEQLAELADALDVAFFLLAHRHVDAGWQRLADRGAVITSDHDHGCVAYLPAGAVPTAETIEQYVLPLASLGPLP